MKLLLVILFCLLTACSAKPPNNPYPAVDANANFYYASFSEQPKTLDPARSYSTNESIFVAQIYEPPLQYHYLKRPYTLEPLTAAAMPKLIFLDAAGKTLPANTAVNNIAYTIYEVRIKSNIYYQPHPAFAKNTLENIHTLSDFKNTGTRELTAEDYVYEIKRLADPHVQSPIFGFLSTYIVGLNELNTELAKHEQRVDLRQYTLSGVTVIDKYTYQIKVKGYYPQFMYWLAMPFFAPIPWEVDQFYTQLANRNINLDWYPIGTGAYLLEENNPNRRMVLARNPNFRGEVYPQPTPPASPVPLPRGDQFKNPLLRRGGAGGDGVGLRSLVSKPLPFVDKFIFTLEKETIPRWTKFLQGYYDQSAISSDSFDQAITVDANGQPIVTPELKAKQIYLQTSVAPNDFYWGFNMLDPVVGGNSERARKLRLAIALAMDTEEFIAIFLNGRGIAAQSPIPPGIFGYQAQMFNPYIYHLSHQQIVRKNLSIAKQLLKEAGYPDGRDPKTHRPLLLNYDVASGGSGDDQATLNWMLEQFRKLGIQLQIRATQYNRFQEIVRTGQSQLYFWGWHADYPDPENFLFLLYGPNGKVKFGGENASNYQNAEYDKLFEQMRVLPNGTERQIVINKMLAIIWRDAPWVWGFHPQSFLLTQSWVTPTLPNDVANNTLKYIRIDPQQRALQRLQWNQPNWWPLWIVLGGLVLSFAPVIFFNRKRIKKL